MADALAGAVVEVHVGEFQAVGQVGEGVVVVLAGDGDRAVQEVLHGMVATVVAEGKAATARPAGQSE